MKREPLLCLCDALWKLGSNSSKLWACTAFSVRDCPTVSKTSCCVENAFSFPSASHFPLTNFYPILYAHSASLNSSSGFLWPSSASRHLRHPSCLVARLYLESLSINVALQYLNRFWWNFFLLWILSHTSLHFTVPGFSLQVHFLQAIWMPQNIQENTVACCRGEEKFSNSQELRRVLNAKGTWVQALHISIRSSP